MLYIIIVTDDLREALKKRLIAARTFHFTYMNQAFGFGDTGLRYGTEYAPGANSVFLVDTEDCPGLDVVLADFRATFQPKQGMHVIPVPRPEQAPSA